MHSSREFETIHFRFLRKLSGFLLVQTIISKLESLDKLSICRFPIEPYPITKDFNYSSIILEPY